MKFDCMVQENQIGMLSVRGVRRAKKENTIQIRVECVKIQQGAGVIHYVFRSLSGGYLISYSSKDFRFGQIFEPDDKPKETKKGRKKKC